jgi:hypothetical protein
MARIDKRHHVDCRHIYAFGQAASVCDQALACVTELSNELLALRAFLIAIYVKDREGWQELPNPTSAVGAKLFGTRYAAMKRNRTLRLGLPYRALDCDLVGHPFRTDKIAINERDAMLQCEGVNLLTGALRNVAAIARRSVDVCDRARSWEHSPQHTPNGVFSSRLLVARLRGQ